MPPPGTPPTTGSSSFATIIQHIISMVNGVVVPTLIGLVAFAFMWGVFQYFVLGGDEAENRTQGRSFIAWSLVAMVVLFSMWGIVNIFLTTFGL